MLLTHHYYREGANPKSTLDKVLHPDPKLGPELEKLRAASALSHLPYRICEVNSFSGGGKQGVSDTFGSALWVLDYMFTLASANAAGVNMETGVNQLGFISWYSPLGDDEHGTYSAKPEYYGMLAFAQAARGQLLQVDCDSAGLNLTAYGVLDKRKELSVTVINKDEANDADVLIAATRHFVRAQALRLTGTALESGASVKLGGSQVNSAGTWQPALLERLPIQRGECPIRVAAGSAAVVKFQL